MTEQPVVAVIGDIVASRSLDDRGAAQLAIQQAFAGEAVDPADPLRATVGDEFQIVYSSISDAVRATTSVLLSLPDELELRFGLGFGPVHPIDEGAAIQDGPGWWAAREAINEAHRREDGRSPSLRSWLVAAKGSPFEAAPVVNAFFLTRDHLISRMSPRVRRMTRGALRRQTQSEIAESEGITQSAVSQTLQSSGASALLTGMRLLDGEKD